VSATLFCRPVKAPYSHRKALRVEGSEASSWNSDHCVHKGAGRLFRHRRRAQGADHNAVITDFKLADGTPGVAAARSVA
jgi:hypothetical protein